MGKRKAIRHYDENHIPRKPYNTKLEAIIACYKLNIDKRTLYRHTVFECKFCHKWHISATKVLLTNRMRFEYMVKLKSKLKR